MSDSDVYVNCPHCNDLIVVHVREINCAIFRHGVMKDTGKQIDPHAPKDVCDALACESKIYGCGKPFRLVRNDSTTYVAEVCEYV